MIGLLTNRAAWLIGVIQASWWALPLSFGVGVGRGVSPMANTGLDGCRIVSHPGNFGAFLFTIDFGSDCILGTLVVGGMLVVGGTRGQLFSSLGRSALLKTSSSMNNR